MKTNLSWQNFLSSGRCLALAALASAGVGLGGCAGAGGSDGPLGQAQLAIANVPNNVHCFRVTAEGAARTVVSSIDVMPGQTIQKTLGGLPTGQVVFTGEGFDTACAAVGPSAVPDWISDPVTATVATSPAVDVSLILRPNGQATIGVDFQNDPTCFPPGSVCENDAQCCTGQVCAGGVCSAPAMCAAPVQVAGDCQILSCDAGGNVVSTADDTDVPADDGNQCTTELCMAGNPSRVPTPAGFPCNQNGGSFCTGTGFCGACTTAAQCPGIDGPCQVRTCINDTCGVSLTAAGTPAGAQVVGDCQQSQCDGAGGIVNATDPSDLPVDGNPCTADVCAGGLPSHPALPLGTACNQGGGTFCDGTGLCI